MSKLSTSTTSMNHGNLGKGTWRLILLLLIAILSISILYIAANGKVNAQAVNWSGSSHRGAAVASL